MRSVFLALALATSAAAQPGFRASFDAGVGVIGDLTEWSRADAEDHGEGVHRAVSVAVPASWLGIPFGTSVRVAYITFQVTGQAESVSGPGVYLAWERSGGAPLGLTSNVEVGYDLYNAKGSFTLSLLPSVVAGIGPHLWLGPARVEVLAVAQTASVMQGAALYGRASASIPLR